MGITRTEIGIRKVMKNFTMFKVIFLIQVMQIFVETGEGKITMNAATNLIRICDQEGLAFKTTPRQKQQQQQQQQNSTKNPTTCQLQHSTTTDHCINQKTSPPDTTRETSDHHQKTLSELIPNFDETKLKQFYNLHVYNLKDFKPCGSGIVSLSQNASYENKIILLGILVHPYRPVPELQIENLRLSIEVSSTDGSYRLIGEAVSWKSLSSRPFKGGEYTTSLGETQSLKSRSSSSSPRRSYPFNDDQYTSVEISLEGYTIINIQNMKPAMVIKSINKTKLNFNGFSIRTGSRITSNLFMQIKNEEEFIYMTASGLRLTKNDLTIENVDVELIQNSLNRAFTLSIKTGGEQDVVEKIGDYLVTHMLNDNYMARRFLMDSSATGIMMSKIIYGETSGKKLSNTLNNDHPYSTIAKILKDQKVKRRKTASKKGSFISVEFDISTSSSSSNQMVSQIIGDKIKKANVFYRDEKEFYLDFTGNGDASTYNKNDCVNEDKLKYWNDMNKIFKASTDLHFKEQITITNTKSPENHQAPPCSKKNVRIESIWTSPSTNRFDDKAAFTLSTKHTKGTISYINHWGWTSLSTLYRHLFTYYLGM